MTPTLSVIMATYNGELYIAEAIQSVLDQSFRDFEFIIVDDGSTDATAKIISSFSDSRIIYLKKDENSGIADSLNLGISKAKGTYIARMDDDDVCMPNRFEVQLKVFENNTKVIVCGSSVQLQDGNVRNYPELYEDLKMALLFSNSIIHPTVMIRKESLLKYPYSTEMVPSEDYDLWSRLIWEGQFYILQSPLLFYRQHDKSETSKRRREQLQLNITIAQRLYNDIGFDEFENHETNISSFTSKDYSISGKQLKGLIEWFDYLKQNNAKRAIFSVTKFNTLADSHLNRFLISYFMNKKILQKLIPFFYLNFRNQAMIINYYFKKLI